MTRRTTILPLLVAMLLGAIGWAIATPAAYAGGPTSVLMTNPGLGRAAALHIDNPAYNRLDAAVGAEATGEANPPSGLRSGDEEVRLTWLIHDMQIWKIDRVHLTSHDGIWVETVVDLTGHRDVFERPSFWHRAHDDKALTAVLSAAGLLGARAQPPGDTPASTTPPLGDGAPAADGTSAAATVTAPGQPMIAIVAAALSGLVIGAAGSLLLLRRRPAAHRPRVTLSG
jgi:hypothetical protein